MRQTDGRRFSPAAARQSGPENYQGRGPWGHSIQYYTILYDTILYCTVLYYTILYYRRHKRRAAVSGPRPSRHPSPENHMKQQASQQIINQQAAHDAH